MPSIVVPVTRTPAGERALFLAKEEARKRDAEILLIGNAVVTDSVVESTEALRDHLTDLEKELLGEGFRCRIEWSVGGNLAEATITAARHSQAELVVLGLRQRSAVGKALLGSFEQDILLDAPCPVLSVRAPRRA